MVKCFLILILALTNAYPSADFKFSQRSLANLEEVHPDLQRIAHRALELTTVDFIITEGKRDMERQKELVAKGASTTLNSKHLTGHAIDVAAYVDGKVTWEHKYYVEISKAFKQAAKELNLSITWGGDWKSFVDSPHFQLNPI